MNSTLQNALLATLFPWRQIRLVEQAGGEIARQCRADLWKRVRRQTMGMSTPEIRGYARAYAAGIADTQVDQILGRHLLKPALRLRVLASGIDQLVGMMVRDALNDDVAADARPLAA
jgi:hypothetical protein